MIKILFVDDDIIARKSIKTKLNWDSYDWDLVYVAKDAIDALDFLKISKADIVVSDIKMPIMDGIQMAQIIRNYYPDIKFIFISGYKEFEYAKKALRLNAVDYLNKPVDTEQLISVLQEAEILFKKTKQENEILQNKYPFIKRHYLSQLMSKHFRETDDSVFKAFDINLANGFGITGFLEFNDNVPIQDKIINSLCLDLSNHYSGSFFMPTKEKQIFFIYTCCDLNTENDFKDTLKTMEEYICCSTSLTDMQLSSPKFHYGTIIRKLNEIYISYESILKEIANDNSRLLSQVKDFIDENYHIDTLSLTQIAEHFYVNHCYLTSSFKEKFGINLYDYLIQIRMKKAGELASSTNMRSYEIAEAVGYKNSQYFSVSFKKYYNCTVLQFKRKDHLNHPTCRC